MLIGFVWMNDGEDAVFAAQRSKAGRNKTLDAGQIFERSGHSSHKVIADLRRTSKRAERR